MSKSGGRIVGQSEELDRLKTAVSLQDTTISALRHEINALRSKTGLVSIPGVPALPPAKLGPCSSVPPTPSTQRNGHLFGGGSTTHRTSITDSSEGYAEEDMDEIEDETTLYDEEEEDDEDYNDDDSDDE